ncbi:MAG: hypothetical protein ACD_11C00108G0006 [uncultured bacterium]|nr:MAG: hypothetical protein ACD_11C00108G0006 [uncultured bacterium]HBR71412.1 hypothetical protein [Candidatus Moranbacteria bacterium]
MFGKKKTSHFKILNKRECFWEMNPFDLKGRLLLYISRLVLFLGFAIIFLDSVGFLYLYRDTIPKGFSAEVIFFIGAAINFFCVPLLYWSSFKKFKNNNSYWDTEMLWIIILFFFGSLFQYISSSSYAIIAFSLSLVVIFLVHIWTMFFLRSIVRKKDGPHCCLEYFQSIGYLTALYLLFVVGVAFFDLFDKSKNWIGY